ncbi:MAG: YebC/PmpR family DNA-binding transcriptional regulator [Chloroflexota bacterium]|jgi:YebC/PmpR family DNA-binding regulatory protein|nr:YebC/PmpR family DNA-binding transcriptional regulator [Chloroflexota bacterium]
MSGHSKWATIKRAKATTDARRGAAFTRLLREIAVAAKEGGGSIESNFRLRLAVDKARAANMPKDNIERTINRVTGQGGEGEIYEELMYEGYGPAKVPFMIQVLTDNRNRSNSDVRKVLTKAGGIMGESGTVGWQFNRKGYIVVDRKGTNYDAVFEVALEAGAEDIKDGEESFEVITEVENLRAVREALTAKKMNVTTAEITYLPTTSSEVSEAEMERVAAAVEALEELDDVQQVYTNLS